VSLLASAAADGFNGAAAARSAPQMDRKLRPICAE